MAEESYDQSLFGSAEEAAEAAAMFGEGKKSAMEGNPVGTFQVAISDASFGKSQGSGKLQLTYKLKVLVGPKKDATLMKYDGMSSPQQTKMTLEQLKRLGVDTQGVTLEKLPAILLQLKDTKAVVVAKQNGDFYNIYFQKAIKGVDPSTTAPAGDKKKF